MYLLSWRDTNFLCIISILSPKSMSKLITVWTAYILLVAKLHKRPYKSRSISNSSHCSTTILSKHITSALKAVKEHVMKYSETVLAIVISIIFGPLKTLPRSSKSCDCVTFRVLKYLLSTFLLYTPHCNMILSKQKCCLWSTGVLTESQNLTSVLHWSQDFKQQEIWLV